MTFKHFRLFVFVTEQIVALHSNWKFKINLFSETLDTAQYPPFMLIILQDVPRNMTVGE